MFKAHTYRITRRPFLPEPLDDLQPVLDFNYKNIDINGFNVSSLEQLYLNQNEIQLFPNEDTYFELNQNYTYPVHQPWLYLESPQQSLYINKSLINTRYIVTQRARYQLAKTVIHNPEILRLINLKPLWGIEFSIDWIDVANQATYELLSINKVYPASDRLEYSLKILHQHLENINWDIEARELVGRYDEWKNLDLDQQNIYKQEYFGIGTIDIEEF